MLVLKDRLNFKNLTICCLQCLHLKHKDTEKSPVKGWKKKFHTNTNQKKAGTATLSSGKKALLKI